jgi:hypothetical protein
MVRVLSKINKSGINYLLIILAFALLVLGVFIFFKFRIKVIEKEKTNQGVTQTKQLKLIISKSAYHDNQIVPEKDHEKI